MDNKTVKDLAHSLDEYATIFEGSTIQEALIALSKSQLGLTHDRHHHRAVLVLDKNESIVGKLSHWAILRSLEPKCLNSGNTAPLSRTGLTNEFIQSLHENLTLFTDSLEQMCHEAARNKVEDAMVPVGENIVESSSLGEAIHKFVMTHNQSLIVTKEEKAVGILRMCDVFNEVAKTIRQKKEG